MSTGATESPGHVITIDGRVPSGSLGVTLPHEHLALQGWDHREFNYLNSSYMELVKFVRQGGGTVVDLSCVGLPRDPRFFKRLADRTGAKVVMATGFYKDAWLPPEIHDMSVEQMVAVMISDISKGVDGTGMRAGVIGEVGVSRMPTPTEDRSLAAAARAQQATGAAVYLHLDIGSETGEYVRALDVLERNGADLSRVAVSHLVPRPDSLPLCRLLANRGCYLSFDLFGADQWNLMEDLIATPRMVQASSVKGFIDQGLVDHILLSHNMSHITMMTVNGGDGYEHLLKNVVPVLQVYSVTDEQIKRMTEENPQRLLAIAH